MTDLKRRSLVAALGAAPFAVPLGHAQTPDSTRGSNRYLARKDGYFPNLVLTDQNGRKLKFYDDLVKDKIVIFNMFYAQCEGICTPDHQNLVRLQNMLGSRRQRYLHVLVYAQAERGHRVSPQTLCSHA